MKRCLITGCLGFTGKHLLEFLQKKKDLDLYGIDIKHDHIVTAPGNYLKVNLSNRKKIFAVLKEIKPHMVFHLAGSMFCKSYEEYHKGNVRGTINLLDAVLESNKEMKDSTVIINVGSSAEYGSVKHKDIPIQENTLLTPVNYYAISKIVQGFLALGYHSMHSLKVIHTRTFNLIGPGQSPSFVCGSITRQIVALEKSEKSKGSLSVGNVKSIRDFIDVRDAVRAYWTLAQRGESGEVYNVCSGRGTSISELIRLTIGLAKNPIKVIRNGELSKKDEVPIQVGDNSRLRSCRWKPHITLEKSVKDMLQWLR